MVVGAVVDLPDRLLAALVGVCVVASALLLLQAFRPEVALPAAAVAALVGWRARLPPLPATRGEALPVVVVLAGVGAWLAVNLPLRAEHVFVVRDPGNYTLTALWLVDHASPRIPLGSGSGGTQGFDVVADHLEPHGLHLLSALAAAGGWVGGREGVLAAGPVLAAFALLAVFALARRVVGSRWALLPVAPLALSLPFLHLARSMYTEPLALALALTGMTALVAAVRGAAGRGAWRLAGAALGAGALARIDGTLPLLGAAFVVAVVALLVEGERERRRLASGLRVLVLWGAPLVVLGLAEGVVNSLPYLVDHMRLLALLTGLLVGVLAALLGITARARPRLHRWASAALTGRGAAVGAGVLTAVFLVLLSRPWWLVSRLGSKAHAYTESLQADAGVPVDGFRTYDEMSLTWLSWYWGWPAVLAGLAGLVGMVLLAARADSDQRSDASPDGGLVAVVGVVLPSLLLYSVQVKIFPDQVWAIRRFVPVVVPGLLLSATWLLQVVGVRWSRVRPVVAFVAALVVAAPLVTLPGLWSAPQWPGRLAGADRLCAELPPAGAGPVLSTGIANHATTIRVLCGLDVVAMEGPTREALAAEVARNGEEPLLLVTLEPEWGLSWRDGEVPEPGLRLETSRWDQPLLHRPTRTVGDVLEFTFGLVQPDGTVVPAS